jgi:maleylpyruvate isomerase
LTLTTALGELEAAWDRLPDHPWTAEGITTAGRRSMTEIVARHLRDVEVHHVDLDVGYAPSDWPAEFVELELAKRLRDLDRRADRAALLAWLLNRCPAPELGPW